MIVVIKVTLHSKKEAGEGRTYNNKKNILVL